MTGTRVIRLGLRIGVQDFKVFWGTWRVWLLAHVMRVVTSAAMWILLGRLLGSDELVRFLLIGQICIVGPQFTGWTVQSFTWDRMFVGTYPLLVAAPTSLVPTMIGRTVVWLFNGIGTSIMTFAVLAPVFGVTVSPARLPGTIAMLAVLCVSTYGFAFCLGSLVNWIPRLRNVVHSTVFTLMAGICGVVVPVAFWPPWVQTVAHVLPITNGLHALRTWIDTGFTLAVLQGVSFELLIGSAWFVVGILTLDWTVGAARRHGVLEFI